MPFPATRLRRLRRTPAIRSLIREHRVQASDLIAPLFVQHGSDQRDPIESLPGHERLSIDLAVERAQEAHTLGVGGILLFGIPSSKDEAGSEAYDDEGIVPMAIRAIKERVPGLLVAADVCLCGYTSHGHCGVVRDDSIDNDISIQLLASAASAYARAGADIVAPSDMMDGRIAALRASLDGDSMSDVAIMSYAAKYSSAFYGPFREAAGTTPSFGDRSSYQMDPANVDEALREVELDLQEGADMVMVKPAMAYLDVVRAVKQRFGVPTAAYNVSGEYAMVKAAAQRGWVDEKAIMMETLTCIKRAGADVIITYAAMDAAGWIAEERG